MAIFLHALLIFLIFVGVDWSDNPKKNVASVDVINASLVDTKNLVNSELAKQKAAKEKARKKAEAEKRARTEAAIRERELKAQFEAEVDSSERTQLMALIAEKVERNWRQPPGSDGLTCLIEVRLSTNGSVLLVNVVKSSGVSSFDRSVEAAVYRSDPLPTPDSPRLKAEFRKLTFKFDPNE